MFKRFWDWYSDFDGTRQIWKMFLPVFLVWLVVVISTFFAPTLALFELGFKYGVGMGIFVAILGIFFTGSIAAAALAKNN